MSPQSSQKQRGKEKVEKEIPRDDTKGKTNVHTKKGNSISSQKNGQHKTNKSQTCSPETELRLPPNPEPSQHQRTQQKTHGARVQGTIPRACKTVYNCHVVICRRLHAHPQMEHRVNNRKITSDAQYSQVQGRSHSKKTERRESHSQHLIIPNNGRFHTRTETQGHYRDRPPRYLRRHSPTSRTKH